MNSGISRIEVSGYRDVVRQVGEAVATGRLRPSEKLPPRSTLVREWTTTPVTVQRAIDELVADGVLRTQDRQGTFVADYPPQLHRIALATYADPEDGEQRTWWQRDAAIQAALLERHNGRDCQTELFYKVDADRDSAGTRGLRERLAGGLLAGMFFTNSPHRLAQTPFMAVDGLPRVALASRQAYAHVPVVAEQLDPFFAKAARYLAARGRRRVAVVCRQLMDSSLERPVAATLAAAGLESRPYWTVPLALPGTGVGSWLQLLLHPDMRDRPDCLIVTDDNLVQPVCEGLVAAGVRVPEDLDVVALWPFPTPRCHDLPITLLGQDYRRVVATCLDLLARQRCGETVPGMTPMVPVFEDELTPTP